MGEAKTTKADFKLFKKECKKWIDFFGLKGWDVFYEHKELDDSAAHFRTNMTGRISTITLSKHTSKRKATKHEIRKSAFHEVFEGLLLVRLSFLAMYRHTTQDELDEEAHNITRILENVIFEKEGE